MGGWVTTAHGDYCPLRVAEWDVGPAQAVAVAGELAAVVSDTSLVLVDLSLPPSPKVLSTLTLVKDHAYASPIDLVVSGTTALIAGIEPGFTVVDIADPAHPHVLSRIPTGHPTVGVTALPGWAFLAVAREGLYILDLDEPSRPIIVGKVRIRHIVSCFSAGDRLWVSDRDRLHVIDISDPAHPKKYCAPVQTGFAAADIVTVGTTAYLLNQSDSGTWSDDSLEVLDLSNPSEPVLKASFTGWGGGPRRMVRRSSMLFVTDWYEGLCLLDISDPAAPSTVAAYQLPVPRDLAVIGRYVVVADELEGLQVFDLESCVVTAPTSSFVCSTTTPEVGASLLLEDTSSGIATSWQWRVDGVLKGTVETLRHTFTEPGEHEIELRVSNQLGSSSTSLQVAVRPPDTPVQPDPLTDEP